MQLVNKHWGPHGMKGWTITVSNKEDAAEGNPPPYCVQAFVYWGSMEEFQSAQAGGSPEVMGDIPNYCDVEPVVWVSREHATQELA